MTLLRQHTIDATINDSEPLKRMHKLTIVTPLRRDTAGVENDDSETLSQHRNDPKVNDSDALKTT